MKCFITLTSWAFIVGIKIQYLNSRLGSFPRNLRDCSEEQGESSYRNKNTIENGYQGRQDVHMLADYCWGFTSDYLKQE